MAEKIIRCENLEFYYEEENGVKPVFKDFNIEIEEGSFVAVLGHNGSGKSTFAKLCNLIVTPVSGSLYLFGNKINTDDVNDEKLFDIRRKIGMVFQNPDNQLVATIVEEDVAFGPENLGVEPSEIRKRVDDSLELVGMKEFAHHSPHQLSGGQKQRVAIAGILALSPEVIVFDEATAMLDPVGRKEIIETIKKLNKEQKKTIILITHYMEEAVEADRVVVLDNGKILLDGTPREVFTKTKTLEDAGLDVPQVTELMQDLGNCGINVKTDILYAAEGAAEIDRYIKGK